MYAGAPYTNGGLFLRPAIVHLEPEEVATLRAAAMQFDWKQVEPTRGATKDGRVANVLLALKALKWKEIASKGGDDAKYGLDKPELEMSVFKADGSEVGTLLVGKSDGAVTYVKVKAEPGIYAVSSKDLEDLRKARTDIPT